MRYSLKLTTYDALTRYLELHDIRLESYMFKAVLKSLNHRKDGKSAVTANKWAFISEVYSAIGNRSPDCPEYVEAKKQIALLSREAWNYYLKLEVAREKKKQIGVTHKND